MIRFLRSQKKLIAYEAREPSSKQSSMALAGVTMKDENTLAFWSTPQAYEESQGGGLLS
jgi:hypothetical protein